MPREAGCLRIVEDHHIAGAHVLDEPFGVVSRDLLVCGALGGPQLATVAGRAVQQVMQALRELEEGRRALDHEPASVDVEATRVAEQRGQHLGDATALGGRVDVPHDATVQLLADLDREALSRAL